MSTVSTEKSRRSLYRDLDSRSSRTACAQSPSPPVLVKQPSWDNHRGARGSTLRRETSWWWGGGRGGHVRRTWGAGPAPFAGRRHPGLCDGGPLPCQELPEPPTRPHVPSKGGGAFEVSSDAMEGEASGNCGRGEHGASR